MILTARSLRLSILLFPVVFGAPFTSAAHETPHISPTVRNPFPVQALLSGLGFEINRGQASAPVRFLAHGPGWTLFLTPRSLVLRSTGPHPSVTRLRFIGVASRGSLVPTDSLPAHVSYFLGHDPRFWYRNIPTYARVEYRALYPGIDLILRRASGGIQASWLLGPGARLGEIRMKLSGSGLSGQTPHLAMTLPLSGGQVFRRVRGAHQLIPAATRVRNDDEIGLVHVGVSRPFRSDASLGYSTYLGGSSFDYATAIAVDIAGSAYVTGATGSPDFPGPRGFSRNLHGNGGTEDAFVAKLDPAGTGLAYATYLGGSADDEATGITVEGGSAYISGFTHSADFPTVNALPGNAGGRCGRNAAAGGEAFVTKLNASGTGLLFSTCLGHHGTSWGAGIAVHGGRAYVVGGTTAHDFPAVRAVQRRNAGGIDAFVAELNQQGSRLLYSTYLGGGGNEQGAHIAVDTAGNMYVTGSTGSANFPTRNALQNQFGGGSGGTGAGDAFVTKLDAAGRFVYSTYLGGAMDDEGTAIAADAAGNAYVTGITESTDFPAVHALQPRNGGGTDVFVARINPAGALVYSTYLGGAGNDGGHGIAAGRNGDIYITGSTDSANFPLAHPLPVRYGGGVYYGDAFVAHLDGTGGILRFSTYLGGSADDVAMGIALGRGGAIYVAGGTSSPDFPTKHALIAHPPPRGNAWLAKIIETATFRGEAAAAFP